MTYWEAEPDIPDSVKQNSAEQSPIETRKEIAKIANVSHDKLLA